MKKTLHIFKTLFIIVLVLSLNNSYAQLNGLSYTINSSLPASSTNYQSFTAAFSDLNSGTRSDGGPVNGPGVTGVGATFTVVAGYTQTAANLRLTATGTASAPIIFKSAGSPNPTITAGIGTSNMDGIVVLSGADYVTFDGIDVKENAANTDTLKCMEFGYALLKVNGTNGCQHVSIKNCTISLATTYSLNYTIAYTNYPLGLSYFPIGIYLNNHTASSYVPLTVTAASGANSDNQFDNNTISNVWGALWFAGYSSAFYDQNNMVGVNQGNTLSNVGATGWPIMQTSSFGIYAINQNGLKIANNNIITTSNNISGFGVLSHNIMLDAGGSVEINNNIFKLNVTGIISEVITAITNGGMNGTINIHDNIIKDLNWTATGTMSTLMAIRNLSACDNLFIENNTITNMVIPSTGAVTNRAIYNNSNVTTALKINSNIINANSATRFAAIYNANTIIPPTSEIYNNNIYNNTSLNSLFYVIQSNGTNNIYSNTIHDNTVVSGTGIICGIGSGGTSSENIFNNSIYNLTNSGTGTVTGVFASSSNGGNITTNTIYALSSSNAGLVYGINLTGATNTHNVIQNIIYGLSSTAGSTVCGINVSAGTTVTVNQNNIYNISIPGTVYGINVTGVTTNTLDQNSIYNLSSSNSTVTAINVGGGTTVRVSNNELSGLTSVGLALTGVGISGGSTVNFFNNRVYDLTSTTATGTVNGISVTGGSTTTIYNNMVADLKAPNANNVNAINGFYLNGGTTVNAYFNSVYLSSGTSSTGANFGTTGIYTNTTPTITLKNNLVVNNSVVSGTGLAVAHRRSGASVASLTADYNAYLSPVIGFDGATSYSFATYKSTMVVSESHSLNVDPLFNAAALTDLHQANMGDPTVIRAKGIQISGIDPDIDGDFRNTATFPDIGFDEVLTPLPIELISFTGSNQGIVNLLQWSTATETNNNYFTLERSIDGVNFELIATVNTQATNGNSSVQLDYHYYDSLNNNLPNTLYYRLKQTDINGASSNYSNIVTITNAITGIEPTTNNQQLTTIYPNPASDNFNFVINSNEETEIYVNLIDVLGRVVVSNKLGVVSGLNTFSMNVSEVSKGSYYLQVSTLNAITQKQVVLK